MLSLFGYKIIFTNNFREENPQKIFKAVTKCKLRCRRMSLISHYSIKFIFLIFPLLILILFFNSTAIIPKKLNSLVLKTHVIS